MGGELNWWLGYCEATVSTTQYALSFQSVNQVAGANMCRQPDGWNVLVDLMETDNFLKVNAIFKLTNRPQVKDDIVVVGKVHQNQLGSYQIHGDSVWKDSNEQVVLINNAIMQLEVTIQVKFLAIKTIFTHSFWMLKPFLVLKYLFLN